jgi:hypothetical protein
MLLMELRKAPHPEQAVRDMRLPLLGRSGSSIIATLGRGDRDFDHVAAAALSNRQLL